MRIAAGNRSCKIPAYSVRKKEYDPEFKEIYQFSNYQLGSAKGEGSIMNELHIRDLRMLLPLFEKVSFFPFM